MCDIICLQVLFRHRTIIIIMTTAVLEATVINIVTVKGCIFRKLWEVGVLALIVNNPSPYMRNSSNTDDVFSGLYIEHDYSIVTTLDKRLRDCTSQYCLLTIIINRPPPAAAAAAACWSLCQRKSPQTSSTARSFFADLNPLAIWEISVIINLVVACYKAGEALVQCVTNLRFGFR